MSALVTTEKTAALKRYTDLEYLLVGDLRDVLDDPLDETSRRWTLAIIDVLLDTLPAAFVLKDDGGYMQDVLDEFPFWDSHVAELRQENIGLCDELRELRARLSRRLPVESVANRLRTELRIWMTALMAHHRHEARLIQTACNLEVGVGD